MPIYGDLRTLPLPDLLRMASASEKTGVLEVERHGISRRIEFRKGQVGSCSSNDPSSRLGQFLLARGRLNEVQLQHLLTLQEATGKRLGLLLVEMGILSRQELATEVETNARETICGLFDWDDAYFRFDDGATLDPDQIEVSLSVEQLIREGQSRVERLARIRNAFVSSGVVLARTEREIPQELFEWPATRRMVDSTDGRRTIAEILLHARAPEFVMLEFLCRFYERGLLEIREVREVPRPGSTLLDPIRGDEELVDRRIDLTDLGDAAETQGAHGEDTLVSDIDGAARLIEQCEYESAVELLRKSCRSHSTEYARRLLAKAEQALVTSVWQDTDYSERFPVLLHDKQDLLRENPTPEESFLMTLIDGKTDLQAILWLSPLREVDVILTLNRMAKRGMIELAAPAQVTIAREPVSVSVPNC